MSIKIIKKERKKQRSLIIQKKRVQKIEDFLVEKVDQVDCPSKHYFTDNEDPSLNIVCREYFVPKDTILTGAIYKLEVFWVLVKGRMRLVEGDHYREIEAPQLLKNVVNIKNCGYAHEDCLFYGFTPNPNNSRDLKEIISIYSATPVDELMEFSGNKQKLNEEYRKQHALN